MLSLLCGTHPPTPRSLARPHAASQRSFEANVLTSYIHTGTSIDNNISGGTVLEYSTFRHTFDKNWLRGSSTQLWSSSSHFLVVVVQRDLLFDFLSFVLTCVLHVASGAELFNSFLSTGQCILVCMYVCHVVCMYVWSQPRVGFSTQLKGVGMSASGAIWSICRNCIFTE